VGGVLVGVGYSALVEQPSYSLGLASHL
jgi:hypothetical protein